MPKPFVLRLMVALEFALLLIAIPQMASAYTDPGSGALIWQALAASMVGVMFYARRIIRFFQRITSGGKTQTNDTQVNS
jgi:hypothetical protein